MNNELLEALNILEQEKNISKETLLEAIENSLLTACKNHFGKAENVKVVIDPDTCEYHCFQEKTVVENVEDPIEQISLPNAQMINRKYELGDVVQVEVKSKEFGRIATQNAKNVILQKIREEERKVIYDEYNSKEKEVVTGVVQRYIGKNVSINLGKADALLTESEQIKGKLCDNIFGQEFCITSGYEYIHIIFTKITIQYRFKAVHQLNFIQKQIIHSISGNLGTDICHKFFRINSTFFFFNFDKAFSNQIHVICGVKRKTNNMVGRDTGL